MYKHHNPKLPEPLLKELLEKLGSNWSDYSYSNDLCASIGYEYKENKHIIVILPNSLKADLNIECINNFSIQLEDASTGYREIVKSLDSIDEIIAYVNNYLKEAK